jgi:hypothetical protein
MTTIRQLISCFVRMQREDIPQYDRCTNVAQKAPDHCCRTFSDNRARGRAIELDAA